ncbi:MAG: hypothetical protein PHD83_05975 [Caldisericia bacterium]|nr:hypothetical protein [Caldisericia bacterium]
MSLLYSVLSISLEISPGFASFYNWYFLPSIIAYGIASRAVEKIKLSHPEIPASRWEKLEHYPNPLKNTFISWCFAIWLFLMICLGPLYLWFYTTERHQYNEIVGFVFIGLIGVAGIYMFFTLILYHYRFLVLADQLIEEYS